jgi:hypothetical protein
MAHAAAERTATRTFYLGRTLLVARPLIVGRPLTIAGLWLFVCHAEPNLSWLQLVAEVPLLPSSGSIFLPLRV